MIMMLSLSTSFISGRVDDGQALVEALKAFHVPAVELEYRIREKTFYQMQPALTASGLSVSSVHNFFPHPAVFDKLPTNGNLFSLADCDREQRRLAVEWTGRTIEHASDLGAPVVVLHCGRVEMTPDLDALHGFVRAGAMETHAAQALLTAQVERRERLKPPHLDALCFSLEPLLEKAVRLGVILGLENRYHFHELPGPPDFQGLFDEFRGAPIGYWHDTGHAHAARLLGLLPPDELPPGGAENLVGMHLHDARGLDDHMAPGAGEIDFTPLKDLAKTGIPLVMELRPGTPDAAVREGLTHLRRIFDPNDAPREADAPLHNPSSHRI